MDGEWRNIETIFGFYYKINVGHDSVDGLMARASGKPHTNDTIYRNDMLPVWNEAGIIVR